MCQCISCCASTLFSSKVKKCFYYVKKKAINDSIDKANVSSTRITNDISPHIIKAVLPQMKNNGSMRPQTHDAGK
jgi:hypothetical protein